MTRRVRTKRERGEANPHPGRKHGGNHDHPAHVKYVEPERGRSGKFGVIGGLDKLMRSLGLDKDRAV
jgi:hypothetical protein